MCFLIKIHEYPKLHSDKPNRVTCMTAYPFASTLLANTSDEGISYAFLRRIFLRVSRSYADRRRTYCKMPARTEDYND